MQKLTLMPVTEDLAPLRPAVMYEAAAAKYVMLGIHEFRKLVGQGIIPFRRHPGRTRRIYLRSDLDAYLSEAGGRYKRPIVCHDYDAPLDLFDRHLYEKGGLVLHMLRVELGDDLLWKIHRAPQGKEPESDCCSKEQVHIGHRIAGWAQDAVPNAIRRESEGT